MTRATLGERAKATLQVRGWRGGWSKSGGGLGSQTICLVEVISLHAGGFLVPLGDAIRGLGFKSLREAIEWNDAPERTFGEVLERLERI